MFSGARILAPMTESSESTAADSPTPFRVLFLCTGNSARSILAEALLDELGGGRFLGYSAGSHPTGRVNPLAIATLGELDIDVDAESKSWDAFTGPDAPALDLVVTVCDNAAGESCPVFLGTPPKLHWGHPDPAAVEGTDAEKLAAFRFVRDALAEQIRALVALGPEVLRTAAGVELARVLGGVEGAE